ncbi:MAG: helix-turn-helix domain-containing protein [Deltaproteobacteria bacterium]|nr:helix-turn-helix domain-containing protein [Deltaproteobacteria bacterium]MBI2342158.1 helix-turn-helix domain-containing protein [Deltaproteobacteria bacterium]MBI2974551.1 helix-turn-helix domain-containing protein [Deltaproteobacteria bacterium]
MTLSVGQYLKRERELRGISLEQIANLTKIPPHHLNAIESDKFDTLPSKIFAKGFVKSYAKAIGLNQDEVVLRYEEILAEEAAKPAKSFRTPYREIAVSKQKKPNKTNFRIKGWMIFCLIAVAVVILAAFFSSR